ncbi:MAG: response regulator [Anaerolineales bacterium]|jgi:DNA-binding NarL/FixJ family response regulator|nr:response regulator [Anaerolineales bacterium]
MNASSLRALLVEDDLSWQSILTELLSDAGLTVDLAGNFEQANALLKENSHRLAVVDLSLAGSDHRNQDGLQILESLQRRDPVCRAILLTGYATVELAVSALTEYGAYHFMRKENFQRAQFREMVQRILASAPPGPASEAESAAVAWARLGEAADAPLSGAARALLVEDDAGWRAILSELLIDLGYQVRPCNSFGEASGCLRREKYQLAVVDLSLSGSTLRADSSLEGFQLLTSTKAAQIATIVVSGVASIDGIQRAYDQQAIVAYLEKQTFDRAAFRRAVGEARRACLARGTSSALDALTERERETLALLAQGMTNKEIGESLFVTTNTVKRHLKSIFEKLDVHTRSAAAATAIGAGLSVGRPLRVETGAQE